MLNPDQFMDIKLLHKEGHSIRHIAKLTGFSRNTIRRVLREKVPGPFQTPDRPSKLDPYKDYITTRYRDAGLSATRIFEEIKAQGYSGSVIILRRFLQPMKASVWAQSKATVRFESAPGHQAQADWAYCGRFPDPSTGRLVSIYAFIMVLGYSRMSFACFTTSMDLPSLIDAHLRAFAFFGGISREILYDNMKQVRLSRERWNPQFLDFASRHGFAPKTHRPFRPRTKGKVERAVHYLKHGFLAGRSFADLADLNTQVRHWLDYTANVRTHGTTEARPLDRFAHEKLQAIPEGPPYRVVPLIQRKVDHEGFVRFERSRYSVPPDHCGTTVAIELRDERIFIRSAELIIAEHHLASRAGSCIAEQTHIQELWKRSTSPGAAPLPSWKVRFDQNVAATPLSTYENAITLN
jgi:transposase